MSPTRLFQITTLHQRRNHDVTLMSQYDVLAIVCNKLIVVKFNNCTHMMWQSVARYSLYCCKCVLKLDQFKLPPLFVPSASKIEKSARCRIYIYLFFILKHFVIIYLVDQRFEKSITSIASHHIILISKQNACLI